jgi:hypothetical protein
MWNVLRRRPRSRSAGVFLLVVVAVMSLCLAGCSNLPIGSQVVSKIFGCSVGSGKNQMPAAIAVKVTGDAEKGTKLRMVALTTTRRPGPMVAPLTGTITVAFPRQATSSKVALQKAATLTRGGEASLSLPPSAGLDPAKISGLDIAINRAGRTSISCRAKIGDKIRGIMACVDESGIIQYAMEVTYKLIERDRVVGWVLTALEMRKQPGIRGNPRHVLVTEVTEGGKWTTIYNNTRLPRGVTKVDGGNFDSFVYFNVATTTIINDKMTEVDCKSAWRKPAFGHINSDTG